MDKDRLIVNRWRRYGKDRLYVETAEGEKLGYWDLLSDEAYPVRLELSDVLAEVRAGWSADDLGVSPRTSEAVDRPAVANPRDASLDHVVTADAQPWIDLATNLPGEAARDQALTARAAAPVRTSLARVLGVHTDERAWRMGADGEERVAEQLGKVVKKDPRWRLLHAVPVGDRGSDIDHVVIGPGGVFTVNAKHHKGAKIWVAGETFMVDGTRQPYIRNSRHEAAREQRVCSALPAASTSTSRD